MKANKRHNKSGKFFIICGPSGSGKTTLLASLIQDKIIGEFLVKSCSITTRPKRSGEREGKEYFFVNQPKFKELLKAKKILEWTRYLGYYYGTPREPVEAQLKAGKSLGLCLDLKGARTLKKLYPRQVVTIFILPPSIEVLEGRIQNRCSQTDKQEIRQRLALARSELLAARTFDYCVLNKNLSVALRELKKIFLQETSI